MTTLSERQDIQDSDYQFPYHYIPQFRPGFTMSYTWSWGIFYVSAMEFVLAKVAACEPSRVADIGTGDGRFARELHAALPGCRVTGIDYSERAIDLARALNPGMEFSCLDITTSKPIEKFDLLTLIEVFEHIPLDAAHRFSESLAQLLDDDGILILTVPHQNKPVSVKHFQHFTSRSILEYFSPHFDVMEIEFLDRQSPWVSMIRRIMFNQYFALRHWGVMNRLYAVYKKWFLVTDEKSCGRIFLKLKKRSQV